MYKNGAVLAVRREAPPDVRNADIVLILGLIIEIPRDTDSFVKALLLSATALGTFTVPLPNLSMLT